MAFDAFISYSHAGDGQLAPALQRAIQRLAKPWYRARALRVFRDESALSANPHLWSSIQTALDESNWFVLLASPEAVASEWVTRELDYWLTTKSADRILVVVTDGTWQWNTTTHQPTGTAVPVALQTAFGDEPRHVDLLWAATETDLDLRNSRFRDVVAQLAAPMHGIAKDDLESEDIRQHRHARRLARGGVTALTLLVIVSVVFGVIAVVERNDARDQRNRADRSTVVAIARGLSSNTARMLADHRVDVALLLSTESYHFAVERNLGSAARDEASASLLASLSAEPSLTGFLRGQKGVPELIAYSPDGALVASASDRGEIRVWDARSREPLAHQPKPVGPFVTTLSINRAHVLVTATAGSAAVRLWDLRANKPWRWQPPQPAGPASGGPFVGARLSDTGVLAVTTSTDFKDLNSSSSLDLWDINTGRRISGPIALAGTAIPGAFSPDGRELAVEARLPGNTQLRMQLFDATTGQLIRTLAGQHVRYDQLSFNPFVSVDFSPDSAKVTLVASLASEGAVAMWDVATGRRLNPGMAGGGLRVIAGSHDSRELLVRDSSTPSGRTASVIDTKSGAVIAASLALPSELSSGVLNRPAAFDPTDHTLAIATSTGTIALLDRKLLKNAPILGHRSELPAPGFGSAWVALSPSGRVAALMHDVPGPPNVGDDLNPGGNWSFSARSGPPAVQLVDSGILPASLQLVDTGTSKPLAHQPPFHAFGAAFGADDSLAISTPDGIVVWDSSHGRVIRRIGDASKCSIPDSLAYAGHATDGQIVLACGGSSVAAWTLGAKTATVNWSQLHTGLSADPLVLSANGSALAISSPSTAEIVDTPTGRRLSTILLDTAPGVPSDFARASSTAVALSADAETLAVARASGTIDLIDARTGSSRHSLYSQASPGGKDAAMQAIAFSPDGAMLVAGATDETLEVWDVSTGAFIAELDPGAPNTEGGIGGLLGFTPDGTGLHWLINVSGGSATITTSDFNRADWSTHACRLAGRNLTRQEWKTFFGNDVPYHRTCPQWPAGT